MRNLEIFKQIVLAFSEYTNLKKVQDLFDDPCEQRTLETIEEMNQKLTEQVSSRLHVFTNSRIFPQNFICFTF